MWLFKNKPEKKYGLSTHDLFEGQWKKDQQILDWVGELSGRINRLENIISKAEGTGAPAMGKGPDTSQP